MIDQGTMLGVLRVLQSCGDNPVRERVIFNQFNCSAAGVATLSEIREHLEHARDKGWADFIVDKIDRARKWHIADEGKVLLREN